MISSVCMPLIMTESKTGSFFVVNHSIHVAGANKVLSTETAPSSCFSHENKDVQQGSWKELMRFTLVGLETFTPQV